jgi:uncharacterized membrane protein HdeD (DUF308 family)
MGIMLTSISRNWWLAVLRGLLAVIFGVAAFVWPGITFDVLVLLFGAFAFVDGILLFGFGLLAAGEHDQWWPLVLSGILGVAVGVLTFFQPAAVALGLVFVIGIWAVVTGLLEIVAAVCLRKVITTEWLMAFTGVVSIIFGVLVLAQPVSGPLALVYLFGFYAVLVGVLQISFGLRLRRFREDVKSTAQTATSTSV